MFLSIRRRRSGSTREEVEGDPGRKIPGIPDEGGIFRRTGRRLRRAGQDVEELPQREVLQGPQGGVDSENLRRNLSGNSGGDEIIGEYGYNAIGECPSDEVQAADALA